MVEKLLMEVAHRPAEAADLLHGAGNTEENPISKNRAIRCSIFCHFKIYNHETN